ncbi:hypothetical protein, unlikely [Trypanosoma brucei gambiense DAL972]|uniref:Uncharacterized protein n=1 Tax=Trypanosoma brucei gambiense (strain MHOM/CI/86/DAL972) TaxID=679716 RepID=C9ZL15_TRYB9|nr:hypothetical protein, unlikely [Trypanosoma brucei gambiense DAL972]CBH10024.1 hypothetical protein, unlikely [Trypanosoma brucei gambiense DAL972]|eukprot:XP_011772314.1 hypothetical protein, unlikely [Trypanosoma brucei gambiense DAL972]
MQESNRIRTRLGVGRYFESYRPLLGACRHLSSSCASPPVQKTRPHEARFPVQHGASSLACPVLGDASYWVNSLWFLICLRAFILNTLTARLASPVTSGIYATPPPPSPYTHTHTHLKVGGGLGLHA